MTRTKTKTPMTMGVECEQAILFLAARTERPLDSDEQDELVSHLRACPACREAADDAADEDEDDWLWISRVRLRAFRSGNGPVTSRAGDRSEVETRGGLREREDQPRGGANTHADDGAAASESPSSDMLELPVVDPGVYDWGEGIGRGGMGRVVRARDRRLGRHVAVKELLNDRLRARFETEARLTARLQHPAIVNVHEAGAWPTGEPFYAMKLVEGPSLSEVVRGCDTLAERLALVPNVITVAEAIAYAHSQGIIHRDLKPGNIVVGPFGETVVIDWGLAKDLREDAGALPAGPFRQANDGATAAGLGTPQYMPLEQALGESPDERVDVYALGATLYHVLAGTPPYGHDKPVALLAKVADGPPPHLAEVVPGAPEDLVAIVEKAMARDPEKRYANAGELAADLERFQTGSLVTAQRYTRWALVLRWLSRHRLPVTVAVALLVVAALFGSLAISEIVSERIALLTEQGRAELLDGRPSRAALFLSEAYSDDDASPALRFMLGQANALSSMQLAELVPSGDGVDVVETRRTPDDGLLVAAATSDGTIYQYRLRFFGDETQVEGPVTLSRHEHAITSLVYSWDSRTLVSASADGTVVIWDTDSGEPRTSIEDHAGRINELEARSERVFSTAGDDGTIGYYSFESGERLGRRVFPGRTPVLGLTADNQKAVVRNRAGATEFVSFIDYVPSVAAEGAPIVSASTSFFSAGMLGVASDGSAGLWSRTSGERLAHFKRPGAAITAITACRGYMVTGDDSGTVALYAADYERGAVFEIGSVDGHFGRITAISDTDGALFATASEDGVVKIWSGEAPARLVKPDGVVGAARFVAEIGRDAIWVSDLEGKTGGVEIPSVDEPFNSVSMSREGSAVVTRDAMRTTRVWDATSGTELAAFRGFQLGVARRDGTIVALAGDRLEVFSAGSTSPAVTVEDVEPFARGLAIAPGGKSFVTCSRDGRCAVRATATGDASAELRGHSDDVNEVAFAGDSRIVTASLDGAARVWTNSGAETLVFSGHAGPINALDLSDDGARALTASDDGTAQLWSTESGKLLLSLDRHGGRVLDADLSPDGAFVATAATDGNVRLWDADGGALLAELRIPGGVVSLAFNGAGTRLVVVGREFKVNWRLPLETRSDERVRREIARTSLWKLEGGRVIPRIARADRDARKAFSVRAKRVELREQTIRATVAKPVLGDAAQAPSAWRDAYREGWALVGERDWSAAFDRLVTLIERREAPTFDRQIGAEVPLVAARAGAEPERAMAALESAAGADKALLASWWEALARAYFQAGDSDRALAVVEQAVARLPADRRMSLVQTRASIVHAVGAPAEIADAWISFVEAASSDDKQADAVVSRAIGEVHDVYLETSDRRYGDAATRLYEAYLRRGDRAGQARLQEAANGLAVSMERTPAWAFGFLKAPTLEQHLRRHTPQLAECYSRALHRDPALVGAMTVSLRVAADGTVVIDAIDPLPGAVGLAEVSECVRTVSARWVFPRPPYVDETLARYRLYFDTE